MTHPGQNALREQLQALLNDAGDGWQLSHYVAVLGLNRITSDGAVENCVWVLSPHEQPDYVTDGLLWSGEEMRAAADVDDD